MHKEGEVKKGKNRNTNDPPMEVTAAFDKKNIKWRQENDKVFLQRPRGAITYKSKEIEDIFSF